MKEISIHTEYIKLDSFLKLVGLSETGGDAKLLILNEKVKVNDEICTMRGKKLRENDTIKIESLDASFKIIQEN